MKRKEEGKMWREKKKLNKHEISPNWSIKPDVEHLIGVSFKRHRSTPLEVSTDASWLQTIPDPGTGDLDGIGIPHP